MWSRCGWRLRGPELAEQASRASPLRRARVSLFASRSSSDTPDRIEGNKERCLDCEPWQQEKSSTAHLTPRRRRRVMIFLVFSQNTAFSELEGRAEKAS